MKKIKKQQAIEALKLLQDSSDTEGAHSDADDILLQLINDDDISKEYEKIPKWYA